MNPEDAVDLGREALKACLIIGGPIVVLGLIVGLVVGLLQAMTQVQDQTVSFVPKILVMFLGVGIALPWLSDKMVDFTKTAFETPMIHATSPTWTFGKQAPWEGPGHIQFDRNIDDSNSSGQGDRLASPPPSENGSHMPRLRQSASMPTMKSSAASSMPMLRSPGQPPAEQPAPRIAEKLDPDF